MPLQFFNTLSRQLEDFKPLREGEVKMYTCGPTVYDFAHIGNFRAFIFEDLLRRFLEFQGFQAKHVMNVTDVDDKTIAGAKREGKKLEDFTKKYLQAFFEDSKSLCILPPNHPAEAPRATHEIPAMLELIEKLIKKGSAYVSEGSVYYRVSSFPNYGKLSKKDLKRNITGARVDVDEYEKEEGVDFVLWKRAKEGEPSWDSPWGKGRPGWHIECSAMSMKYLGESFDIHAGGEDLVFPHHENEIAQSEGVTGKKFVNYWLHCKHLLVNSEKMSKSKGNFYTLRDLLAKGYDPVAIRYALLSVHYRQPLNFTLDGLKEASEIIKKLDDCYWECLNRLEKKSPAKKSDALPDYLEKMAKALGDDLNISEALASLFDAVKEINSRLSSNSLDERQLKACLEFFTRIDKLLGLNIVTEASVPAEVIGLLEERQVLRKNPNFREDKGLQKKSDDLRKKIEKLGWLVKDGKPGESSTLKKKRRTWD